MNISMDQLETIVCALTQRLGGKVELTPDEILRARDQYIFVYGDEAGITLSEVSNEEAQAYSEALGATVQ